MEELVKEIMAAMPNSAALIEQLTAAVEAKIEEQTAKVRDELVSAQAEAAAPRIAELESELETAKARVSELEGQVAEKDLAIEQAREASETLSATVAELEGKVTAFEAEAEEAKMVEVKASRLNDLPEVVRTRFLSKDENTREALLARWAAQTDVEWAVTKEELSIGVTETVKFRLPAVGRTDSASNGRVDLSKFIKAK
jgi:DNA repair exonuclease SbcCD ATPase subunit